MDTIDNNVLQAAAEAVTQAAYAIPIVHTVTITLNGQHGGADCRIQGFTSDTLDEPADVTLALAL